MRALIPCKTLEVDKEFPHPLFKLITCIYIETCVDTDCWLRQLSMDSKVRFLLCRLKWKLFECDKLTRDEMLGIINMIK